MQGCGDAHFASLFQLALNGEAPAAHCCCFALLPPPSNTHEQAKDVKKAADYVSQLRRAGPGHSTFHMDVLFQNKYGDGSGPGFDGGAGLLAG